MFSRMTKIIENQIKCLKLIFDYMFLSILFSGEDERTIDDDDILLNVLLSLIFKVKLQKLDKRTVYRNKKMWFKLSTRVQATGMHSAYGYCTTFNNDQTPYHIVNFNSS